MRRVVLVVLAALVLGACGTWRHVEHREIDGVDCAVVVNEISGNESEPNCDWTDR